MFKRWLRRNRPASPRRVAPHAEWLEPRLLFSADLAAGWLPGPVTPQDQEERTLSAQGEYAPAAQPQSLAEAYVTTALNFEQNVGQARRDVDFIASGSGYTIALADGDADIVLAGAGAPVHLEIVGGRDDVAARGEGLLDARSNYLLGNDKSKWLTDIANYRAVLYEDVYRGVDVRYYGTQRKLEYDFIVAAGADAAQIRLRFEGAEARLDADGNLLLRTPEGRDIRFDAPVSYQQGENGREAVTSSYRLHADGSVSFRLGAYDQTRELVIDPVLNYASYFGESGTETGVDVAVDAAGKIYVTGSTDSSGGVLGSVLGGLLGSTGIDTYVARFNDTLSDLEWVTRVGGNGEDRPTAMAVTSAGSAVVTGWSKSTDLATAGAADTDVNSSQNAFVYRLGTDGAAVAFATYYGDGIAADTGNGVALDASGNIHVAGTVGAANGKTDAFVARYGSGGALQLQFRYGGGDNDVGNDVAVDGGGNMYLVGTSAGGSIAMVGGHQTGRAGQSEGFLARFDSSGAATWSTYIGGNKDDTAVAVAVDAGGRAYVVGDTDKSNNSGFALTSRAWDTTRVNAFPGYLRIYDTAVTGAASLQYSTLVGGADSDHAIGVGLRGDLVVVLSEAGSAGFAVTTDALKGTHSPGTLHIAVINPGGTGAGDLIWGTYYGASVTAGGLAVTGTSIYVAGSTSATGQATTGADRTAPAGNQDAVVGRIALTNNPPVLSGFNPQSMLEDQPGNGFQVLSLITGKLTDTHTAAVLGIAITGSASAGGSWEYSTDGGDNWEPLGTPTPTAALLLAADSLTRLRFTPAAHYNGNGASITFRGWDRTTGTAGGTGDASSGGGSTAYSTAELAAPLTVTAVNDEPQKTAGTVADLAVTEASGATSLGLGGLAYDAGGAGTETGQGLTYTVTDVPPASFGRIVLADGTTTVLQATAYTLGQLQGMQFIAGTASTGTRDFEFRVRDDGGVGSGGDDSLRQSLSITIINVAPVLDSANPLPVLAEDPASNTGMLVADLVAGRIVDPNNSFGIAVIAASHPNGSWQYSRNGGNSWSGFTGVSEISAVLLAADAQNRIRFLPSLDWNGTAGGLEFRAWDRSGAGPGATTGNASATGGSNPYSDATAFASITITPVNDAPVAAAPPVSGLEDATSILVTLGGSDVDGTIQSVTLVTPTATAQGKLFTDATLLVEATPGTYAGSSLSLYFVPAANFNGNATFTYTVTDDLGLADASPATATITVTSVNDAPVAGDVTASGAEDAASIAVVFAGSDVDGTVTRITFTTLPTAAQGRLYIDSDRTTPARTDLAYGVGSNTAYFVPASNFNGTVEFNYTVTDNNNAVDATPGTVRITVASVNDAPVASTVTASGNEDDASIAITLGGSDVDGTIAGVTLSTLPTASQGKLYTDSTLLVEAAPGTYAGSALTLYFVPAPNFNGSASFTYTVTDDLGLADASPATASIAVAPVNDVPAASDVTASGAEDAASIAITLTGSDVEGAISSITLASLPTAAEGLLYTDSARTIHAVAGTAYNASTLALYFVPAANFNGTVDFTYTVTDGAGVTDPTPATARLVVTAVNDAPVASGASASGDEDALAIPITLGGTDMDGAIQSVTLATVPTASQGKLYTDAALLVEATAGTYAGSTLTLYFVPALDFNGNATFTYSVTDDLGLAAATPATATIAVAAVNDAPKASGATATGAEDAASIAITLGGTDVDGAIAKVTLATLPGVLQGKLYTDAARTIEAVAGTAYDGSTLALYFVPAANFNGTVDFDYTVTDDANATDATPVTASVVVTSVNDAPQAGTVSQAGLEDAASIAITLGGSDLDGSIAAITLQSLPNAAHGLLYLDAAHTALAVAGTGHAGSSLTLYFAPAADFNGPASFSYTVTDDQGATGATPATATLNVTALNDAPVASGATASGAEDAASITVTLNGSDVDGTPIASFTLVTLPTAAEGTVYTDAAGTILAVAGAPYAASELTLYFVPAANFNGTVDFSYTVADAAGAVDATPATASITVSPVNDVPVAGPASATGAEDAPAIAITLGGSDVEGAVQSVTLQNLPANGLLYLDAARTLLAAANTAYAGSTLTLYFVPAADFAGTTGFDFRVTDAQGLADPTPARATLTVTPVNDAPVLSAGTLQDLAAPDGTAPTPLGLAGLGYGAGGGADEALAQALTVTVTALPSTLGQVLLANGTVVTLGGTYTVGELQGMQFRAAAAVGSGPDTFSFTVSDNGGTAGGGADSLAQSLSVTVVNRAPVLTGANPLPGKLEDAADGNGMLVADLIAGRISDPQNSFGIAVVAASSPGGSWQYSRDGGASWQAFTGVSATDAVLLEADSQDRIRFVALADWAGSATGLVFRGWDQSGGTAGATTGDTTTSGDNSPYSAATAEAGIVITPVNDQPVLAGANALPAVLEDAAAGNGMSIADLVRGQVTDVDPNAVGGIAVTAAQSAAGSWQFSTDNGASWSGFGAVSDASARLLAADGQTRIRFVADADWHGNAGGLVFRAWDRTGGTAGQALGDTTAGGVTGPYSAATAEARIVVTAVNDAPVQAGGSVGDLAVVEGGTASLGLAGLSFAVGGGGYEATQTLTYTVTTVPAAAFGSVLLEDGTVVVAGNSYTLAQVQGMRFAAAAGVTGGSASFGFAARDSGGTANGGDDLLQRSLAIVVRNQAPVLAGANELPALLEDATGNAGMLVADLVAGHISDPSDVFGIAVVAAASPGGSWEYSRDGGSSWSSLAGASESSARLLAADSLTRVRFVPAPDWNGTASGLAFRAWDRSGGTAAEATAEARSHGGATPFSSTLVTASVVVTPVNDAPVPIAPAPREIVGDEMGPIDLGLDGLLYAPGGAADEGSQSLSMVITALPPASLGTLYLADGVTPVQAGAAYSMAQLRGMHFVPAAGSGGGDAAVAYVVRDDGGTEGGGVDQSAGVLQLRIGSPPLGAAPVPLPGTGSGTGGTPAPAPAPVAGAGSGAVAAAPSASAGPGAGSSGGGRESAPQAATGDALVDSPAPSTLLPSAAEMSFAVERRVIPLESVRPAIGMAERGMVQLAGFTGTTADFQVMGFNDLNAGGTRLTIEQLQQTLRSEAFLEQMNKLRDGLRQEFDLDKTVSISVAGVSLGLSVAYVLWLVRGGVLVGSYLSALPAWRLLDPLPVLAHAGEEEEDEEDEPLAARGDAVASDPLRGFA